MNLFTDKEKKQVKKYANILKANASQMLYAIGSKQRNSGSLKFGERVEMVEDALNEVTKIAPLIIKALHAPVEPDTKKPIDWP